MGARRLQTDNMALHACPTVLHVGKGVQLTLKMLFLLTLGLVWDYWLLSYLVDNVNASIIQNGVSSPGWQN